jgi:hypothetical protein
MAEEQPGRNKDEQEQQHAPGIVKKIQGALLLGYG